jgi:hypothetical protein
MTMRARADRRILLAIGLVLAAIIATMALLLETQWRVIQWTR